MLHHKLILRTGIVPQFENDPYAAELSVSQYKKCMKELASDNARQCMGLD